MVLTLKLPYWRAQARVLHRDARATPRRDPETSWREHEKAAVLVSLLFIAVAIWLWYLATRKCYLARSN